MQAFFVGPGPQQGCATHQQLLGLEGGGLGAQLAGSEAGGGQYVVEHRKQVVGRFAQQAQVVVLALAERGFGQYPRQAQNAVQRRPNLVAHVGQKVFFGLGIHFGGGDGGFQGLLGAFEFGDVAIGPEHLPGAVGACKQPFHGAEPRHLPVGMGVRFFQGNVLASGEHLLVLREVAGDVAGGRHERGRFGVTHQLGGGQAKKLGRGLVGQQVVAPAVFQVHWVRQRVNDLPHEVVLLAQARDDCLGGLVGRPAVGDVLRHANHAAHVAVGIARKRGVGAAQPAQGAVAVMRGKFNGQYFPVGQLGQLAEVFLELLQGLDR